MSRYQFLQDCTESWPMQVLCHVLNISCAGYYQWRGRARGRWRHTPPAGRIVRRGPRSGALRAAHVAAPARVVGSEHAPVMPTHNRGRPGSHRGRKPAAGPTRAYRPQPSLGQRHHLLVADRRAPVLPDHLTRHLLPAGGRLALGHADAARVSAHKSGAGPNAAPAGTQLGIHADRGNQPIATPDASASPMPGC